MNEQKSLAKSKLTTPRAAAIAGIVFSILLIISLILIRLSVSTNLQDTGSWLNSRLVQVSVALNLIPFAGIAFLWFIGVVRDRLGAQEDRFFATVFLGSGILFLAMLFTAAGLAGGVIRLAASGSSPLIESSLYHFAHAVTHEVMNVYAMKMAGVFMIVTSTLSLRTGIVPRWMAFLGLGLALLLLFSLGYIYWATLVFPLWVLLISVHILLDNLGVDQNQAQPLQDSRS